MIVNGELGIPKSNEDFGNIIPRLDEVFREFLQSESGIEILSMLKQNPKLIEHFERSEELDLNEDLIDYACWYAWYSNEYGVEKANEALDQYFEDDVYDKYLTLWVTGLKTDFEIRLSNDICIVPIENMPITYERRLFQFPDRRYSINEREPKCALVYKMTESKFDKPKATINHNKFDLLQITAHMINGLCGSFCTPSIHKIYNPDYVPPGPFIREDSGYIKSYESSGFKNSFIRSDHKKMLDSLLDAYLKLGTKDKDRIKLILMRLRRAKESLEISNQILELAIAAEMLLLDDNAREQLSLTFRLRGALLLDQEYEDRKETYDRLKEFYILRSMVVHSGRIKKDKLCTDEKFNEYVTIIENVFQKILLEGKPNWEKVVLGGV